MKLAGQKWGEILDKLYFSDCPTEMRANKNPSTLGVSRGCDLLIHLKILFSFPWMNLGSKHNLP